ncbi:hypothetical protein RJ55_06819 [Drechmeria coniospora]|nr:hypothetical protein RJ55_06819 [Drechmeria coniospora]
MNRTGPNRLRDALKRKKCLFGLGIFNDDTDSVVPNVDFDILYLAGGGAIGSVVGQPDLSIMTATDVAKVGEIVVQNTSLPVITDADAGFGGPANIRRTVRLYELAGFAGCHIGDQVLPTLRCSRLHEGVVDLQTYVERIRNAVEARYDSQFVIIAGTSARKANMYSGTQPCSQAFDEAVKRLKTAMEVGADIAFMESARSKDEMRMLVRELSPHPVLMNELSNSLMGHLTTDECEELGLAAAIFPGPKSFPTFWGAEEFHCDSNLDGSDLKCGKGSAIVQYLEQGIKVLYRRLP